MRNTSYIGKAMGLISYIADSCTNCINIVSEMISNSAKKAELAELDKIVLQLRYPAQREAFFNRPDAKAQLTYLVEYAKRLGHTNAVRHFEDYLSDLAKIEMDYKNKPFELLKAMIEKEGIPRPYQNVIQTKMDEPLQAEAPAEVYQEEPAFTQEPLQSSDWNTVWDPYLELEIDELADKFAELMTEDDPIYHSQEAKRVKEHHEDLGHIPSLATMESTLFYNIWCDKSEVQLMPRSLRETQDNTDQSQKRPFVLTLP